MFLAAGGLVIGCAGAASSGPPPQDASDQASPPPVLRAPPDSQLWIEMRNVTMHLDDRATIRVGNLRGQVVSTAPGKPAVLDDRESFSIRISSGRVGLTAADLTTLLNDFVFAYRGAPLKRLRARVDAGQVSITGTMHKGVDLHFDITATVTLTPEGMIRLQPAKVRILGVDGQKLLGALGLHLDDLMNLNGSRGATAKGDDIYLDPTKILPPPAMVGTLAMAAVEGSEVVIKFAVTPEDSVFGSYVRPDSANPNFVYFRGGQLRFGKLLMDDTDLQIVDANPLDPFDLNLEEYAKQLVAGTARILPSQGLWVEMPDYASLGASRAAPGGEDQVPRPPGRDAPQPASPLR